MIASLAMYDLPWLRAANDGLWAAIAHNLSDAGVADVPSSLTRGVDLDDVWRSPSLLLAQTCGYPLMTELRETVQLVATPRYGVEGCEGVLHRAAIVVRVGEAIASLADLRGKRLGVNGLRSNTGMNLLRASIAPVAGASSFFGSVIVTGSHARSLAAILAGRIDVASIDAVTFAYLKERYPRHASKLRILDWTAATPGLPLVTAASTPPETVAKLRRALDAVSVDPQLEGYRYALHIDGFEQRHLEDYAPVIALEVQAKGHSYPVLG